MVTVDNICAEHNMLKEYREIIRHCINKPARDNLVLCTDALAIRIREFTATVTTTNLRALVAAHTLCERAAAACIASAPPPETAGRMTLDKVANAA